MMSSVLGGSQLINGVVSAGAQIRVRVAKFPGQSAHFPTMALVFLSQPATFATNRMKNGH
jgi:hypothetical protein